MEPEEKPPRGWREIAEEASKEGDPERLKKLAEELLEALERDSLQKRRQSA
jgi:ribosomal protein S7